MDDLGKNVIEPSRCPWIDIRLSFLYLHGLSTLFVMLLSHSVSKNGGNETADPGGITESNSGAML